MKRLPINLCGAIVLMLWLLRGHLLLPVRGRISLWLLVAILIGLSLVELVVAARSRRAGQRP